MSQQPPGFNLVRDSETETSLVLSGAWVQGQGLADFGSMEAELHHHNPSHFIVDGAAVEDWDSILLTFLLQCHNYCQDEGIEFSTRHLPEGATRLLTVATAVKAHQEPAQQQAGWLQTLSPTKLLADLSGGLRESLAFIGELTMALGLLVIGKSNTRFIDFRHFCYQSGPDAFAIISLTSLLIGMIIGYLGAVQLQQFGAGIYVADLVVIGMLREMGVLMTAVVMAGRTGAAYAAQLGTMQTNEEIDAITTMGISPMEFLVVPRVLALMVTMPLLTLYADLLGMVGGGIVAGGMGITPLQYISQGEAALSITHLGVGLSKSVVFAILIAVAGCRAGINSGRSSAAVGDAATEAVVTAIVYLIVADAAINIILQQVGI